MHERRPILVTGSTRSGTTWAGLMLGASPEVGYIHEPFHVSPPTGEFGARIDKWFTYISGENESVYRRHVQQTLGFRYNWSAGLGEIRSLLDPLRAIKRAWRFARFRLLGRRPLIKDPLAIFSAEWLADTFGMDVIVMIRHPAAFAASLKARGWPFPFIHFLEQPLLMKDHLVPFEEEIREFADRERDILDQAGLLWKIVYSVVEGFRERRPDWIFLRHEDLCRDPMGEFAKLFERLGLTMSEKARRTIVEHSDASNPTQAPDEAQPFHRHSQAHAMDWKKKLTPQEIERIRSRVGPIADAYYSNDEW